MDLYNEKINEFIDWVNGKNVLTDEPATNGLSVSGGKIRELLLDHLRNPFFVYEDKAAGLYRMFSSREAWQLWYDDKDSYSDLELFNFVRPSDYAIELNNLTPDARYVTKGSKNQTGAILSYTWDVRNDKGSYADSVTVTYSITTAIGKRSAYSKIYNSTQKMVEENIYDYLDLGQNVVTVSFKASSTGATASISFSVVMLELTLKSNFNFSTTHPYGAILPIPFTLNRNDSSSDCSVLVYIDGQLVKKVDIPVGGSLEYGMEISDIINTYAPSTTFNRNVTHNLLMWALTEYTGITFKSNILYYTFQTEAEQSIVDYFINVAKSFDSGIPPFERFELFGTQYEPVILPWGYYTDQLLNNTSIQVDWVLVQGETTIQLGSINGNKGQQSEDLNFTPTIYSTEENPIYLQAFYGSQQLINIPCNILQTRLSIYEAPVYDIKISAYGKTNQSSTRSQWDSYSSDGTQRASASFTGVRFDDNSGWYQNSFRVAGLDQYATFNYNAFSGNPSNGRTIEFEFESEKVNNNNDIIMTIGNPNGARIEVTPNKASLRDSSGAERIYTNFKSNERLKLAFIINEQNSDADSQLLFIVNNGILERASAGAGIDFGANSGSIVIGKSNSGIRFYSLRVYERAITYNDEYNNFIFDSEDKTSIINRNNVINAASQQIDYDLCSSKLDTILISGDLTSILTKSSVKTATNATIERFCPTDTSKNFKVENCMLRKHGQSTLNYPITSMKFWLNKDMDDNVPLFTCEGLAELGLAKNRYKMKDDSVPANKFVLQANYADSSGVHNGGLLRMIQSTWYNAIVDGERKLRTEPQLFSTNETATLSDGTIMGRNELGKQWGDYMSKDFPYPIRVSPDSVPCVVFYKNTAGDNKVTFLGQYVLMDDKKSDFTYGERSIYKASPSDPFCLTIAHKSSDKDENCIWDNSNVLRIEVLNINTLFSSYMSMTDGLNVGFEDIIYDSNNQPIQYRWELDFEMIYPDPDDVAGRPIGPYITSKGVQKYQYTDTTKFGADSEFLKKAKPFIDWYKWLVSTYHNQQKFLEEAAEHLDLYKLAAYYIYVLRFALVDSMERNAQIKTYDGVHFHYEPWDMDIALGNKNTGGIAFDPPIDRNSTFPGSLDTYAISGRSGINGSITSNWLWDALEAWQDWSTIIVPKVAQALYLAGLDYNNATKMFDEQYAQRWCEILYNLSGDYKYVLARGNDNGFLDWLLGARTTHRHWWLSTSMDYYDAKWGVGDFMLHDIYIAANKNIHATGTDNVVIAPTSPTYITLKENDGSPIGTQYTTKSNPASFDISSKSLQYKVPFFIYGASYIEKLDLSCIANGIDGLDFRGAYSSVLGACIKELNIGTAFTQSGDQYIGSLNTFDINIRTSSSDGSNADTFAVLETLNVRGQREKTFSFRSFRDMDRSLLKNVYAMGSMFSSFWSSLSGNQFDVLELPGVNQSDDPNVSSALTVLDFNNSSWNELTFWDGYIGNNNQITVWKTNIDGDDSLNIPSSLQSLTMTGTTCNNANSKQLVLDWIDCIVMREGESGISSKKLQMDNIYWAQAPYMTFDQLRKLAMFNNGNNQSQYGTMKGYIVLSGSLALTTEQMSLIRAWFGDSVFNVNSSGLVIDQNLNYIQISVGQNARIENNLIWLDEGKRASLNATKFALSEDDTEYFWFVQQPGTSGLASQSYRGVTLEQGDDGITYIVAAERAIGDYDVEVFCTSQANNGFTSDPITIKIKGVTYPSSLGFTVTKQQDSADNPRGDSSTSVCFLSEGVNGEFSLNMNGTFTATVLNVVFSVREGNTVLINNLRYSDLKGGTSEWEPIDLNIQYRRTATSRYGIVLGVSSIDDSDFYKEYTVRAVTTFKSGKSYTTDCKLVVMEDNVAIVQNDGSFLYKAIHAKYMELFGQENGKGRYFKYDLMNITGTLSFASSEVNAIETLRTQNNRIVLEYLKNVTGLNFSGCTHLLSSTIIDGENVDQLVFTNMTKLQNLNLTNCSNSSLDQKNIDLSSNTAIKNVTLTGTTITVTLLDGTAATSIAYGTPTSIVIKNPTTLTKDNISIANNSSLNSIELINIHGNTTYRTFAKLMNITI